MKTLKQILEEHPEWENLPVAIHRSDGSYDFVGESGSVYVNDEYFDDDNPEDKISVVVFAPN